MRILLATPGTAVGGAERVVIGLARALPGRGHEVTLWGPAGALEPELDGAPVERIVVADHGRSPLGVVAGAASLAATVRRVRPSVVHAHNPRVSALAAAGAAIGRGPRRPPVLATFHGVRHAEYRAASALLRSADLVTCVSEDLALGLRDAGLRAPRVIPNSVAAPAPASASDLARLDAELGLGPEPLVVAVGRLVEQKRHDRLVDAAAAVSGARFLIVGDGPLRGSLDSRASALGLGSRVTLTGVRHDIPALLARADLVVFSSDWEGLPLVALEALVVGTPVLSTPVEGMRELPVAVADANGLAAGIRELLGDPARRAELIARGRAHVTAHHSPAAMLVAYEALYRELSGARGRRSAGAGRA
jgi:glycosyltransferase involved in cell wall biosynthesis